MTPENRRALFDFKESYLYPSPGVYFPYYAPCPATHPAQNTCWGMLIDRFLRVFRWMLPIYGALHFIPTILFKRKQFMKDPLQMLLKASWGTCRSSAFLGTFVIIYQSKFSPIYTDHSRFSQRSTAQVINFMNFSPNSHCRRVSSYLRNCLIHSLYHLRPSGCLVYCQALHCS